MAMTLSTEGWTDDRMQNFVQQLKAGNGIHAYKVTGKYEVEAHPSDATQRGVVEHLYNFYSDCV